MLPQTLTTVLVANPDSEMRKISRPLGISILLACTACGLPTRGDVELAQTVSDMGSAVQELQQQQLDLQAQLDSLTQLVRHQDSTMRSLANLMGAPMPR